VLVVERHANIAPPVTPSSATPIYRERLFELPAAFPGVTDGTWLAYLPVREHRLITGYSVNRARDEAGPYKFEAAGTAFCAYGAIDTDITDSETSITLVDVHSAGKIFALQGFAKRERGFE